MTDGLKDRHREAIIAKIAANDRVERAVLFGSRATGTNTVSSDVDIALFGDRLTLTDQARLAAALDEIPMAQSVDLLLYDSIRDRTLREHIRTHGVEWYVRARQMTAATIREVIEFAIGGGWGQETEFEDSVHVRIIRGTDFDRIQNGEFSAVPARYEKSSRVERRMLKPSDILLEISGGSRTSNQSTGRSFLVSDEVLTNLGDKVIPASFCRLVRFNRDVIDPRHAYYALQEMYGSGRAALYEQQSTGISNFQFEYFLDSEVIRLPPLEEQRAIAHVLGTLDDKIDLNRRVNATLEAMARALFRSWFVVFDPVRAKMEGRDTGLPREIADLFPDRLVDSELGEIPEGWTVSVLGDMIGLAYGKALKATARNASGGVPVFGSNGQIGWHNVALVERPGIIVGRKGNPGTVTLSPTEFFPIDTTFYVVPKHVHDECLYFVFFALQEQDLPSVAADSAVPGLNRNLAYMNKQLRPPTSVVECFDGYASTMYARCRQAAEESRLLISLRDTLLPKLVSGELRMNAAEPVFARDDRPASVGANGA